MPYRITPFIDQSFYHIYNRGVEKRNIFSEGRDYQRFLKTTYYYQFTGKKPPFSKKHHLLYRKQDFTKNPKSIEIVCYCLMPNHFHLLIQQNQLRDGGIHKFMQKVLNSYTKYFNTKNERIGPLLQGTFKAVPIESDEQLIHVSRYIHLNPIAANLTHDLASYPYSSYPDYIGLENDQYCNKKPIMDFFKGPQGYKEFVAGHSDYAKELEIMKHQLIDGS